MDIKTDEKVLQWLRLIDASANTRNSYLLYMKMFAETAGKAPTVIIDDALLEVKAGKLPVERKDLVYISKFLDILDKRGSAPKTKASALAAVKSFFRTYDIQLTSSLTRHMKKTNVLEANANQFINHDDIKKMVLNAASLRDKAIILTMASSGMSRLEIINLKFKNVERIDGIGIIRIRRQKSNADYITFISPEALGAIDGYIEERNRSIITKVKNEADNVFVTYDAGRSLNVQTFSVIFHKLGRKLGYRVEGGLTKTRSHSLRKFFASTLENAGIPKNKIDYMFGHVVNGTDSAYFNQQVSVLKNIYIEKLALLTFEKEIVINTIDSGKLETLSEENESLKAQVETYNTRLDEMEQQRKKDQALNEDMIKAMIEARVNEMMKKGQC